MSIDPSTLEEEENNSETEDVQKQIGDVSLEQNFTNFEGNILSQETSTNYKTEEVQFPTNLEAGTQCRFTDNQIQSLQFGNIQNSHAQILKRLPVILPSSQFVIKPAQTVLKPSRNVRILPNTNKILNSVHTINGSNQNSILLPKTKLLNGISSQLLKATPLTTQLLNSNNISAQFLNASDIPNHVISTSRIATSVMNATPVSAQNIINSQICLSSPVMRTGQRQNTQHFLTPVIKTTTSVASPAAKNTNILSNGHSKNSISGQILKSVQVPAQMLRTVNASMIKHTAASPLLTNTVANATTFRTGTLVKSTQDLKSNASILRSAQLGSTPISILKPQSKTIVNNSTAQNLLHNTQSVVGNSTNNSSVQQCSALNSQNEFSGIKQMQNNINIVKMRQNGAVNGAASNTARKTKPAVTQKPTAAAAEKTDTTKPLGSSENPIQIVQQGHTFHR